MGAIWDFFEEFDEMVYVSNVKTYELIYMNAQLRNSLGYSSHEEYQGKKCYQVLQGSDIPCTFCTNGKLKPGEFISWTHKNPVMDKRFLVKDSIVTYDGKLYRIEIAIDIDSETVCKTPYYYARSETILNECLQQVFSTTNPDESIRNMLSYIGETFLCDRAYIFEIHDTDRMSNTYEWCRQGVIPQKDILQDEALDDIAWWMQEFEGNNLVVIQDIEDIRTKYPSAYALLKPQNISTLAVGPIKNEGQVVGFLGVDNPDCQMMNLITPLLNVIGYFSSLLLKRRDLLRRLNELSFRDQLTGALNRNALAEYYERLPMDSVGVIYCDITGLKQVNDSMGHDAGDQMIRGCYHLTREVLDTQLIYRTGGDEFVALFPNCGKDAFHQNVLELHNRIHQNEYHIAAGYVWSDQQPLNLEKLIAQADQVMYQDKREYYTENHIMIDVNRRGLPEQGDMDAEPENLFQRFLATTYYDIEVLFQSIAQENSSSYFYFGDMQRDIFYISDNMRDEFGFQNNIVPGLLPQWAQRISTPESQELFWRDLRRMLQEKSTVHNLRYQVKDIHGKNMWIQCYGIMKWDESKSKPLFFSGRVTHQDENFVVDPITNFPREHTAFIHLNELKKSDKKALIIGFGLNNISEINNTRGRSCADRLLKNIADQLIEQLSYKVSFYRLEGMRCLAVLDPAYSDTRDALVGQIRNIVEVCYHSMGISLRHPCSFGVMDYPCDALAPEDLVENIVSLIKVARQDTKQAYVDYSTHNLQQIRQMSNMALTLSQDVLKGMKNFRIVIQPVVSAGDGQVLGGETLLRWSFEGKDISPAVFIPILEKENMIHQAGRWVFEQAVCSCMRVISYYPDFYLTFNVSLHQLSDGGLLDFMEETMEKYHLDGSHLVAELTESCLDEQPEKLNSFVDACQKLGIRIALDDFGSGYSSLRMLLQYPSSIIKLDRSLLQEVTESDGKMNFVRSIVYACHQFGKQVCMEGVEREDQNSVIQDTGCDMIQGFYYYRPLEMPDLFRLLSEL